MPCFSYRIIHVCLFYLSDILYRIYCAIRCDRLQYRMFLVRICDSPDSAAGFRMRSPKCLNSRHGDSLISVRSVRGIVRNEPRRPNYDGIYELSTHTSASGKISNRDIYLYAYVHVTWANLSRVWFVLS